MAADASPDSNLDALSEEQIRERIDELEAERERLSQGMLAALNDATVDGLTVAERSRRLTHTFRALQRLNHALQRPVERPQSGSGEATRQRSPAYPTWDLERALDFARLLWAEYEDAPIDYAEAIRVCGYSPTSSSGQRTIAALRHFGIVEEHGAGSERQLNLSPLGKRLVVLEDEDLKGLADAALNPRIYQIMWDRWGARLPEDRESFLIDELGFNPNAVEGLLEDYLSTLQFAGLMTAESGGAETTASPAAARTMEAGEDLEVSVPLASGDRAVLRVPIPITGTDLDLLDAVIQANLEVMRRSLTSD